jgi:hypothetical protein
MHSSFKHKTKQQIQCNQVGGISELKTWNKQNQLNPDMIFQYMATDVEQEKPTERILTSRLGQLTWRTWLINREDL